MFRFIFFVSAVFATLLAQPAAAQSAIDGAWRAESYHLKSGTTHPVSGHIFFTEGEWTVLFFVHDGDGEPKRGSAEGGTFTIEGNDLVFTHLYNLSVGEQVGSLAESPLRMESRGPEGAPREPTTVSIDGTQLTLFFPSGNSMVFHKGGT